MIEQDDPKLALSIRNLGPSPLNRHSIRGPLSCGVRAIDAFVTCGRARRVGVFGGRGVGKSKLLGLMARGSAADVTVMALVGERGREVREFLEGTLGEEGRRRAVVVVSTSDQSPLLRIRAALVATTVAEYFAMKNRSVLLVVDSLTRLAMAQREIGLAAGELPTANVQLDMNLDPTGAPTAATGTLTATGNANNNETVTVGLKTYTFVTALSTSPTVADQVLIGTSAGATLSNLVDAVNGASDVGTNYSTETVASTQVTVTASDNTPSLQALSTGTSGNSIITGSTMTSGSFYSTTLTAGAAGGTFSTPITVYDSLGNSHVLTFNFNQTSNGNWTCQITVPAADVGKTGSPQTIASGTLQFNSSGQLVSPSADVMNISVAGLSDGAKTVSLNWQLYNASGSTVPTQTAEPSATSGTIQDGYGAGTLQSYSINSNGVIEGVLSNGQTLGLWQIALATFKNYGGLTNLGSNDYEAILASGAAGISAPGTGGGGTLDGGSLEASNVDIATAFTQLIEAERGCEANAKAITTADDVTQAFINLIQS